MQIPERTINEIRDRADIVDIVGRHVDLRRAGTNFKAICPFHEEKTPSFIVSPDKQIFHCFGCGQGGNVFTFLMEMEGVSFPEAVRELGKQYGIEVTDDRRPDPAASRNEVLYRVNDFAARFYSRNLMDDRVGKAARKYLEGRGINENLCKSFQLGWASESWDAFAGICARKNIPVGPVRELKLVVPRRDGNGYFDYFRKRVMFPIASASGRVVAFGGRGIDRDTEPKYLNSIESAIFHKRRTLYGIPQAREAIRKERTAIVVEGYMDCIALHAHGIENVVASCGTALTADHASQLRRLTRHVVFIPDADTAGIHSVLVAGSVFLATGLDVTVVPLDEGQDPDDAVNASGGVRFRKKIGAGVDYLQYLDYIMSDRPMTPREKEALVQRISGGLSLSRDPIRYDVILKELASALRVEPENLRKGQIGTARVADRTSQQPHKSGVRPEKRVGTEKLLLRLLLETTPETAAEREKLDADDFSDETCRDLYNLLDSAWENHIDITSNAFQQEAEKAGLEGFAAEIALISIPPGNTGILLRDTVKRVKELQIRDELGVLREKLQELPEESDDAVAVAEHYARLKRALSEL